jgi:hypothetical protein
MTNPSRPRLIPRRVYLPEDLDAELRLRFFDPLRNKGEYGSFSPLVVRLLREHLAAKSKP